MRVVHQPIKNDAKTASMLNINPTTAVLLLDEFVKLKAKDWIVLNAANALVARCLIAIAIAKSRDLNVVGIVRRAELIPEITALGVDFPGVDCGRQALSGGQHRRHSGGLSAAHGSGELECEEVTRSPAAW